MQQVIVDIDAAGNVKVEAHGVKGQGCQALTRAVEEAIGRTIGDVKKPEYHQQQTQAEAARAESSR